MTPKGQTRDPIRLERNCATSRKQHLEMLFSNNRQSLCCEAYGRLS